MKKILKAFALTAILGVGIGTCDLPLPGTGAAQAAPLHAR